VAAGRRRPTRALRGARGLPHLPPPPPRAHRGPPDQREGGARGDRGGCRASHGGGRLPGVGRVQDNPGLPDWSRGGPRRDAARGGSVPSVRRPRPAAREGVPGSHSPGGPGDGGGHRPALPDPHWNGRLREPARGVQSLAARGAPPLHPGIGRPDRPHPRLVPVDRGARLPRCNQS
jgi:hypothetical protein